MPRPCYVTFTMDCETIQAESPPGGPEDFDVAGRAITGYVAALRERGHCVTLFPVPRLAEVHAEVLKQVEGDDCEIGMHYHPQTLDCAYDGYIGDFSGAEQYEMLGAGLERIIAATGAHPTSFRSGNFSANDETFPTLVKLGFRQGSVSLPGRMRPQFAAEWPDAVFFPHRANAEDKCAAGDLDFWEMPVCAELERIESSDYPGDNRHLRIEGRGFVEWSRDLLERYVAAMVHQQWQPKVVVVMTHNVRYYEDPDEPARQALEHICDCLDEVIAAHGLEMTPATLAAIGEALRGSDL